MRICITSRGRFLWAPLDSRFGRCNYFIFYDLDKGTFEALENQTQISGGDGIQAARTVADRKVDVVITGNIGPNAFKALTAAKIKVITGAGGTVEGALNSYKEGNLVPAESPTVEDHYGL